MSLRDIGRGLGVARLRVCLPEQVTLRLRWGHVSPRCERTADGFLAAAEVWRVGRAGVVAACRAMPRQAERTAEPPPAGRGSAASHRRPTREWRSPLLRAGPHAEPRGGAVATAIQPWTARPNPARRWRTTGGQWATKRGGPFRPADPARDSQPEAERRCPWRIAEFSPPGARQPAKRIGSGGPARSTQPSDSQPAAGHRPPWWTAEFSPPGARQPAKRIGSGGPARSTQPSDSQPEAECRCPWRIAEFSPPGARQPAKRIGSGGPARSTQPSDSQPVGFSEWQTAGVWRSPSSTARIRPAPVRTAEVDHSRATPARTRHPLGGQRSPVCPGARCTVKQRVSSPSDRPRAAVVRRFGDT
ncbi:hypothetical protein SAMN04489730_8331 [Amycolatopsis australiensis]|uniref:Uncharacterized protein n=1 Tax=Amycolatopsis australiensis TaxID=546364 RepID=A0A1K1T625_9PSEU|nr:hypothetical protein SAMN04489730_8331 [Amycolatopsis australiensis]